MGKPSRRQWWAVGVLCAVTAGAYANSFPADLTLDAQVIVGDSPRIRTASAEHFEQIWNHEYWWPRANSGLYRPVTTLSYLFNYSILGNEDRAEGYHWINLLLHCANVFLAYALAFSLFGEFWPALLAAALWAVHPVLTESVTNIVGRADLLCGIGVLSGLLLYRKGAETAGLRRAGWFAGLFVASLTGMFSKESAAVIPAAIILYELALRRRRELTLPLRWGAMVTGVVICLAALGILLYQRSVVFAGMAPVQFPFTDNPLVGAGFWVQRLTALKVIGLYISLLIWPVHLSADYSFAQIPLARGSITDWFAWSAALGVIALGVELFRRRSAAWFFVAFGFLTLLPGSNLLFPIGTIMAERLLYLPGIGFAGCLAAGVWWAAKHRGAKLAAAAATIVILLLATRTFIRNRDWLTELTLARATAIESPNSHRAHRMLARALFAADPSHAKLGEVIDEASRAVAIVEPLPDSLNSQQDFGVLAGYLLVKGDLIAHRDTITHVTPEAMAAYREALRLAQRSVSIAEARHSALSTQASAQALLSAARVRVGEP